MKSFLLYYYTKKIRHRIFSLEYKRYKTGQFEINYLKTNCK